MFVHVCCSHNYPHQTMNTKHCMKQDSPFHRCWAVNENMNYWWIIRLPILFASLVKKQKNKKKNSESLLTVNL